jgi:hypothetical protein
MKCMQRNSRGVISDGGDTEHADGARLRLWTAATNGAIVHPPGDVRMKNHDGMI